MDAWRSKEGGREAGREERGTVSLFGQIHLSLEGSTYPDIKWLPTCPLLCLTLIVYHGIEQTESEEALGIISADTEGVHEGIQEHLAGDHQPMVGGPCGRCL